MRSGSPAQRTKMLRVAVCWGRTPALGALCRTAGLGSTRAGLPILSLRAPCSAPPGRQVSVPDVKFVRFVSTSSTPENHEQDRLVYIGNLGTAVLETSRKHMLCDTSKMEAFYEKCDDSFTPMIKVEPCEFHKKALMNFSMTFIPKKDIDRLSAKVQIRKESMTVSEQRYVLCSGFDDEYDFCGALKGETLNLFHHNLRFTKLTFIPGLYTVTIHLLVGAKEEMLACFVLTVNLKAAVF